MPLFIRISKLSYGFLNLLVRIYSSRRDWYSSKTLSPKYQSRLASKFHEQIKIDAAIGIAIENRSL